MKSKKFWSLLLILCMIFAFSSPAMAASDDLFQLNVTSADSYRGISGTNYQVSGVDVKFAAGSNSNTDDYGTLYLFTKSGTAPVGMNISVCLDGHEETRKSVKVTTIPGEYVVLELKVNMDHLVSRYGRGEDSFSTGDGYHYFYYDVYDAAGSRIAVDSESGKSKLVFAAHVSNAYEVQKPADPRDTPEVFSFTDDYDGMGGQWLYSGSAAYAYRCYFTLVTGANAGSYSMTFPDSENTADVQSFSADANSVYKLTYTYPLAAAGASYKYSGTVPWSGPKGTKGSFALSFTGGKVSKGKLTVEKISGAASAGFSDVPSGAYYAEAVKWAVANNITNGTSTTTFSPANTVTRAQAVTFLWRSKNCPEPKTTASPFKDVQDSSSWYYKAVLWAVENGITNGTSTTTFSPENSVTRGQMITFLYRTLGEPGKTGTGAWYADAEKWAGQKGMLTGTAATYTTDGKCPRSDVVYYLWKIR